MARTMLLPTQLQSLGLSYKGCRTDTVVCICVSSRVQVQYDDKYNQHVVHSNYSLFMLT